MESRLLGGEIITPQVVEVERRLPNIPRLSGSGLPFTLCYMHEWEFVRSSDPGLGPHVHADGEWLPMYREIRHNPGGNGVRTIGRGMNARIDPTMALAGMAAKGAVVVRPGDGRLGKFRNYLTRHKASGKYTYFYCFAAVKMAMLDNDTNATPVVNWKWMLGLRRQMVEGGIAEPMSPQALDSEIQKVRNRVIRWREMVEAGEMDADAYTQRAGEAKDLIGQMSAAWDRQYKAAFEDMLAEMDAVEGEEFQPDYNDLDQQPDVLSGELAPKKTRRKKADS